MKGMTLIVKTVTRLTLGLIMLFGFYILMHGHISHGVGFAGGIIIALGFIHLMLAYGKKFAVTKISEKQAFLWKNAGLLLLLGISSAGFIYGKGFLGNFLGVGQPFKLFSGGIMLLLNLAICVAVAGSLYLIFLTLIEFKIKK